MPRSVKIFIYVILCVFGITSIFPFLWMISTSFKDTYVLYRFSLELIPKEPTLMNYVDMLTKTNFLVWGKNSVIVTSFTIFLSLFFNSLAAYAFAKKEFWGRNVLFIIVLGTMMIPINVLIIPVFVLFANLNLVDTYLGLIIPGIASGFAIFLLRQYMLTIPNQLIDAAKIDGCSEFGIYYKIVLPLCKPALSALAILIFVWSWNVFLWPLILTTRDSMRTLPVGIAVFQGQYVTRWGLIMAGASFLFFPTLLIFLAFQRYFIRGIALSGLKG